NSLIAYLASTLRSISTRCRTAFKSASCGHILPKYFKYYRTKNTRIYLAAKDDLDLNVPLRNIYSYTFEDVEFPNECDFTFLNGILRDYRIVQGLRTKRCFPTLTNKLKDISSLYDFNNE